MATIKLPSGGIIQTEEEKVSYKLPSGGTVVAAGSTTLKKIKPTPVPVAANQNQSNNTPSVTKQTGNALDVAKQVIAKQQPTRQLVIGFNQPIKPQPLPYAKPVAQTLPRADDTVLQKAKQIAQQAVGKTNEQLREQNIQKLKDFSADRRIALENALYNEFEPNMARAAATVLSVPQEAYNALGALTYTGIEKATGIGGENKASQWAKQQAENFANKKTVLDKTRDFVAEKYTNQSESGKKAGDLTESVTRVLTQIAMGRLGAKLAGTSAGLGATSTVAPKISKTIMALSAGHGGMRESLQEGASKDQAVLYGTTIGALEAAVESAVGGIGGMGKGVLDDIINAALDSPMLRSLVDTFGEIGEEELSLYLTPLVKRAIYDKDAKMPNWEDVLNTATTTAFTTLILQGATGSLNLRLGTGGDAKLLPLKGENATAAEMAGQLDVVYGKENAKNPIVQVGENSYNVNGGDTNGQEVHLRNSGERAGSENPSGELQPVEGRAGQDQNAAADPEAAAVTYGQEVSTRSLGVENGSETDSVKIVTGNYSTSMKKAAKMAESRGKKVTFFAGNNLTVGDDSVRGYINGDEILIRADHPLYTAEQLMEHELGHDKISSGEISVEDAKQKMYDTYGEAETEGMVALYEEAYRGSGLTTEEVWEEIVCDSLGGMNIFSGTVFGEEAGRFIGKTQTAAINSTGVATGIGNAQQKASRKSSWGRDRETLIMENNRYDRLSQFGDDLPKTWYAFTSNYFYYYENISYETYKILKRIPITDKNAERINVVVRRANSDFNQNGRMPSGWAGKLRSGGGPNSWNNASNGNPQATKQPNLLAGGQSGSNATGNTGQGVGNQQGVKPKFSLETVVEETPELIAIHNMTSEKLSNALELGGLPMPSIAVVRAAEGHSEFGAISLVFGKDTIDPKANKKNKVYGGDAYTPTFPRVDYPVDYDKVSALDDEIKKLSSQISGGIFSKGNIVRGRLSHDGTLGQSDKIWMAETLAKDPAVKAAYLADRGITLNPVMKDGKIDKAETAIEMQEILFELSGDDSFINYDPTYSRVVHAWIKNKLDGIRGEPGIRNGKDAFTPSGNRRTFKQTHDDYTLENALKAMLREGSDRGVGTLGANATTLQAVATPSYRSVQDIKADSGRLGTVSVEKYKKLRDKLGEDIEEVMAYLMYDADSYADSLAYDDEIEIAAETALLNAAKGRKTETAIIAEFKKNGIGISSDAAKSIQGLYKDAASLPTGYFEAKPKRAVMFDEVLAAIIPDDTDPNLVSKIEAAGMMPVAYKAGNEVDRLAKLNEINDARFSTEVENLPFLSNLRAQQLPPGPALKQPQQIPYAPGYKAAETPVQPTLPRAEELNGEQQKTQQSEAQPLFREPLKVANKYSFDEDSDHKDDAIPEGRVQAKVDQVLGEKRKTFDQWMNVAKELGMIAAEDGVDILQTVYSTWYEIHPNRKNMLNRQGASFVPFDVTDWRTAIVGSALDVDPSLGERMRWNEEEGRYEDFESFWWNNDDLTEQQAWQAFNSNEKYGANTVGSAQVNPSSYAHLQNEHGTVEPGENPARVVDMPKKDADGRKTSLFARTVAESNSMPDSMVEDWEQAVASGEFSHDIATDKAANRHAERELGKGWDYAMNQWKAVSEGGKIATKNDLALGQLLLANAMKDGDTQTAMRLTAELCAEATRAGQAVQSFRLLKKMTPEGMLYYLQKTVNNLNSDFEGRRGFEGIKIDEGMAERLGNAATREEMDAIVDDIKQDIAAQTPVTWYDKWNAWRYLSMLGNPTTQVRNVLGNALFVPAVKAKNLIATGIEAAWKKNGRLPYATKAVLTSKDKGLVDFADKDFANVVQEIQGGGKYSDRDEILGNRQIFKNKFLEGWRTLTNTVMDKGDEIFSRQHYKASLAQYMKANKLNPDTITPEQLNKARSYAVQEAQRATYRDASSVASLINRAKRTLANTANKKDNELGKRAAARAGEVLLEGFVPFTKTPVNIVKRGIEYSPIGLAQGTINLVRSVKNGEVDAAAAIDRMAAGLTGSGLLALGAWLASLGLVSGGPGEDDREEKYKGMLGEQDYALKLGDTTYTIDWMAPEALPFFTGVELYKEMQSKDGITLADTIGLISAMSDPIVELSMLSSMNSTFESIKYSQGDALSTVAGNLITSYLGQAVPTIGGKIARTIDDTSRQTYYDPNKTGVVKSADAFRQKAQAKIPFAANALPERVDLWGRTEKNAGGNAVGRFFYNMLSPGYLENKNVTKVDNELLRLAEATGDSNVYPDAADKTFKVKGESVKLDAKQYTKFAKAKGQTAFEILEAAVDSGTYKKMSDAEKADFVKTVYEYANAKAKAAVSSYQLDGKNAKIAQAESKGIKPAQYLTITGGYDKNGNGSVTQEEAKAVLDKTNLTTAQKAYMWQLQNKAWKEKNNPYK